ncbi:MAG: aminotransferase class I/II-fold pyridoxal phosphate-dependent enzyme, partial [Promethearchaeota archaeon]
EKPLMMIDAAYTNYIALTKRLGRGLVSIARRLQDNGKFSLPDINKIEEKIQKERPGALVVIPYDNPTGQFYNLGSLIELAKLCVKYNIWMVSDEAYRELYYVDKKISSIWAITDDIVPGIEGRRISIETTSKVWNACGLRIGALITDNKDYHIKSVFEATANLCAPAIAQYIFGGLAHESPENLHAWFSKQREYYRKIGQMIKSEFTEWLPGVIISSPDASIYSVIDVRNIAKPGFDSNDFVMYCTKQGKVKMGDKEMTLLVAPMGGFYQEVKDKINPGKSQMRIAYVETPEKMRLIAELFANLFAEYESNRN